MKRLRMLIESVNLLLFEFDEQHLNSMVLGTWKKTPSGIEVEGSVKILPFAVQNGKIKYKFTKVSGLFDCSDLQLTSLENCPKEVHNFNCMNNSLRSYQYGPTIVHGDINCTLNQLENFKYFPKKIGGSLLANMNMLEDVEDIPEIGLEYLYSL